MTAQMMMQPTPMEIPRTIPRNGSGGSASNAAKQNYTKINKITITINDKN